MNHPAGREREIRVRHRRRAPPRSFAHQADAICITEKDAVKLSQLHAIEDLKIPILVLSIGIEFVSGKQEFIENLEI